MPIVHQLVQRLRTEVFFEDHGQLDQVAVFAGHDLAIAQFPGSCL